MDPISLLNTEVYAGNTPVNGLMFLLGVFLTLSLVKLAQHLLRDRLMKMAEGTETQLDDVLLETLDRPVQYILYVVGFKLSLLAVNIHPVADEFAHNTATVVATMFMAWTITRLIDAVRVVVVEPWAAATESKLDDQIVPILDKTLKVGVWCFTILIVFSNLGYDVISLLTGLGIGGLAVAMAAQATLSNVFGSVTIFADQPFQVDDLITVAGHKGVVAEVGLRTCRIRTLGGEIISIPNASVVDQPLVNHSPGDDSPWRYEASLGLVYSTSAAEVQRCIDRLEALLEAHELVMPGARVRFVGFGDSALDLKLGCWVNTHDAGAYLDFINRLNLDIKALFEAEGWEMAFPSVSVYLSPSDAT